jgi:ligand-binding sensor domain-containing protein
VDQIGFKVINSVRMGREGSVWVSSDEGMALMTHTLFARYRLPLSTYYLQGTTMDGRGNILTSDGRNVFRLPVPSGARRFVQIAHSDESLILSLASSCNDLWIGYKDNYVERLTAGVVRRFHLPPAGNRLISSITADATGNLWLCKEGIGGVLMLHADARRRVRDTAAAMLYDSTRGLSASLLVVRNSAAGVLLGGAAGNGTYLFRYEPQTDRFSNLSTPLPDRYQPPLAVNDLAVDRAGTIWLATNHGMFTQRENAIRHLDVPALHDGDVRSVSVDSLQTVWAGLDRGIVRITGDDAAMFDDEDGLPGTTVSYHGTTVDREGRLYVATSNGLGYWQGAVASLEPSAEPLITAISANGRSLEVQNGRPEAVPSDAYLEATFNGLAYPSGRILYQTRMPGYRNEWSEPTTASSVLIPRLPAGSLTFQVRMREPGRRRHGERGAIADIRAHAQGSCGQPLRGGRQRGVTCAGDHGPERDSRRRRGCPCAS